MLKLIFFHFCRADTETVQQCRRRMWRRAPRWRLNLQRPLRSSEHLRWEQHNVWKMFQALQLLLSNKTELKRTRWRTNPPNNSPDRFPMIYIWRRTWRARTSTEGWAGSRRHSWSLERWPAAESWRSRGLSPRLVSVYAKVAVNEPLQTRFLPAITQKISVLQADWELFVWLAGHELYKFRI